MARFAFLSDEWVQEARRLRAEYEGKVPPSAFVIRMNQIITDVPFGEGKVLAHLDTSSGEPDLDLGHLEQPDLTVTTDYQTAKSILIEGDAQAAIGAFMAGRIRVDGDITKLLALQSTGVIGVNDPVAVEMARRLQDMTE
ncbi:MAG TPA: hypothetical protein VG184_04185 [Acidimicrobiales bacterium]|nr:hypothetical protein [Acidimicrobiales bacterium]